MVEHRALEGVEEAGAFGAVACGNWERGGGLLHLQEGFNAEEVLGVVRRPEAGKALEKGAETSDFWTQPAIGRPFCQRSVGTP